MCKTRSGVPSLFSLVPHLRLSNSVEQPKNFLEKDFKLKPETKDFKNLDWLLK